MGDSSGSIAIDMETIPLGGQEHILHTSHGTVSVSVFGDIDRPALITYPDVALNHMSCFQGLFFCPEATSLLLHNFCIYHIDPPGHELGAAGISSEIPIPSVDDLADQVAEVLDFFGLNTVICMGVTAGAYIITLFAEFLLQRYFSKEVRGGVHVAESDIVTACRRLLDERQSVNVTRFLEAISRRHDITEGLKKLKCKTLIFVGENSPCHSEALYMVSKMDRKYTALVEVQSCGSMVTEEQPHAMLIPLEYFLMGYGVYRQSRFHGTPTGPLSPSCISPELLSPESMGLKLKPIKTRISSV